MLAYSNIEHHFSGKKVLLTGHTGFKGAWMTRWLYSLGALVTGCSLDATGQSLYKAIDADKYCRSSIMDLRDAQKIRALVTEIQPDIIFHFAAQSLVGESYTSPIDTYAVNTMGTVNLLSALSAVQDSCVVIIITTDKVYENHEWVYPYRETDRLGGHDPYSCSKACAELVTDSFRRSFYPLNKYDTHKTAIATARSGNVIGGGDWNNDHLVPDIINAVSHDRAVPVRNPDSVRPWQHVLEPLFGYLLLATNLADKPNEYSGEWNFGPRPNDTLSVREFVEQAVALWGAGCVGNAARPEAVHEAKLLLLDSSKAQSVLGWSPVFNVQQAIDKTLLWYREYLRSPQGADKLVADCIADYIQLLKSRQSSPT